MKKRRFLGRNRQPSLPLVGSLREPSSDSYGLHYKCVLACDIDKDVRAVYQENFKIKPKGDIRDLCMSEIPDFDILCAGFPCQPFSIAGKKEGFNNRMSGNLFYNILEIIDEKRPDTLFLENVKNLYSIDGGKVFKIIKFELDKRGYHVVHKIINSKYYNCPQSRERIYIICSRKESKRQSLIDLKGAVSPRTLRVDPLRNLKIPLRSFRRQYVFREVQNEVVPVSSIIDYNVSEYIDYTDKYEIIKAIDRGDFVDSSAEANKPKMTYKLINKKTGKGARQGERIYSIDSCGPTICASSGGLGAKTGLYEIPESAHLKMLSKSTIYASPSMEKTKGERQSSIDLASLDALPRIRRLTIPESLQMFGFNKDYKYRTLRNKKKMLYFLGNSIVVNVLEQLIKDL